MDAREGDTQGVIERLHGRPPKLFQLALCECGYFQLVERVPREKINPLACLLLARVFSCAHYFQVPATQAVKSMIYQMLKFFKRVAYFIPR